MGTEQPGAAGAEVTRLRLGKEGAEVVTEAPQRQPLGEERDLDRAAGLVQVRDAVDAQPQVALVELVGHGVERNRLAVRVDRDAPVAAIAGERYETRATTRHGHQLLVLGGRGPRHRRAGEPGRVVRALDQEAVALLDVLELVRQPGVRRAEKRVLVAPVHPEHGDARMQAQVFADGGAADAGAQQQRGRLERPTRDDHRRSAHRELRLRAVVVGHGRLDACSAPVLGEHAVGVRAYDDLRAGLGGVAQPRLVGRELAAGLVAKAEVTGALEAVLARVGVADDLAEVPAERLAALLHPLVRLIQVAGGVGRADALEDGVEVTVVLVGVDALEPVLARPLLAHPRIRAQAVRPVDHGAAAERGARLQRHVAVRGRSRTAAPVHLLVRLQLELGEVGFVEVAGRLQHHHLEALPCERARDHSPARS